MSIQKAVAGLAKLAGDVNPKRVIKKKQFVTQIQRPLDDLLTLSDDLEHVAFSRNSDGTLEFSDLPLAVAEKAIDNVYAAHALILKTKMLLAGATTTKSKRLGPSPE